MSHPGPQTEWKLKNVIQNKINETFTYSILKVKICTEITVILVRILNFIVKVEVGENLVVNCFDYEFNILESNKEHICCMKS